MYIKGSKVVYLQENEWTMGGCFLTIGWLEGFLSVFVTTFGIVLFHIGETDYMLGAVVLRGYLYISI